MNNKKIFLYTLSALVLMFVLYTAWSAVENRINVPANGGKGTVCTMDAFQCADGTWVGRTGPNCQFVCSAATGTPVSKETTLKGGIGTTVQGLDVSIRPTKIIEDSRCPIGVQCIQAGTVRVEATVVSGLGTSTPTFTLDKPITTEAEIITLIAVTPSPKKDVKIATKDYLFTWKVVKR